MSAVRMQSDVVHRQLLELELDKAISLTIFRLKQELKAIGLRSTLISKDNPVTLELY